MGGQPVERLRQYLRQLSPGARALLIAELERTLLRGDEVPGGDLVLQEVRQAVRESGASAPRIGNPARLFFYRVEPFLVDDTSALKHQGRIARAALEPIWAWIGRDLLPAEAKTYAEDISGALLVGGNSATCDRLTCDFQDRVAERIQHVLAATASDEKMRRRLAGQIGTNTAIDDVRDLSAILQAREALALIGDRLPGHVRNLADAQLDAVKAALDYPAAQWASILPYALVLAMSRLAAPWQLIRLAVKAAQSDDAARIAATPYAAAVTIVLAEIERMVGELKTDLKRGGGVPMTSLLKGIHDSARGVRTELDLPVDSPWGRQLAAIRADISTVLKAGSNPPDHIEIASDLATVAARPTFVSTLLARTLSSTCRPHNAAMDGVTIAVRGARQLPAQCGRCGRASRRSASPRARCSGQSPRAAA